MNNFKQAILERIDKKMKILRFLKFSFYEKFMGPGLKKKIYRILLTPQVYIYLKIKNILKRIFKKEKTFSSNKELLFYFIDNCNSLNELKTMSFFVKNLKENDVFYDIGAEVGLYTSLALEFCKEVHSFEPIPKFFEMLTERFGKYQNVYLNKIALSDKKDYADIYESPTTIIEEVKQKYKKHYKLIKVNTDTLESYISNHSMPTAIKMDVEGAEYLIIKGGEKFFKENSPIIAMEVLGDEFLDVSLRAVNLLLDFGYKIFKINCDGELESCQYEEIKQSKGVCNYVFRK